MDRGRRALWEAGRGIEVAVEGAEASSGVEARMSSGCRLGPRGRHAPPGAALLATALLFLAGGVRPAAAGATDQEYQQWAAGVFPHGDQEGLQRGKAIACAFCQVCANAVQKQFDLNKGLPRDERFSEEQTEEVLLELCETTAPDIASRMQGIKKDALMLCKRIVREHVGDMLDAASLGEDMNLFCKENKICPLALNDMSKILGALADLHEKQKDEEEEEEL